MATSEELATYTRLPVICPFCESDYMHPMGVNVRPTATDPSRDEVDFTIIWRCEDGHQFLERYRFHEGNTTRELADVFYFGDDPEDEDGV